MDLLVRFNSALDYIENNLDNEISYTIVAKTACCSEYHFSRMFSSLTGVSLSEYIRRRRLTKAAFEIQKTDIKIIDIALKYGYDSPDSFTRAFRKLHGVVPTAIRDTNISLKAYPRISFHMMIKGDVEMDYRIEKIDFELRLVGMKKAVNTAKAFKEIPPLWGALRKNGMRQKLIDMAWENPKCKLESLVGVCGKESSIMDEEFDYFMGVQYDGEIPDEMEELIIPPSTYAVFPHVVDAWKRLYSEWVPTSGYELANLPCIEHYLGPGHKIKHELWVPIIVK